SPSVLWTVPHGCSLVSISSTNTAANKQCKVGFVPTRCCLMLITPLTGVRTPFSRGALGFFVSLLCCLQHANTKKRKHSQLPLLGKTYLLISMSLHSSCISTPIQACNKENPLTTSIHTD